jgi:paraquat-inducible protein B
LVIATKVEVTRKRLTLRSSGVQDIARDLTNLGLVHVKQDGALNIRQSEKLRRALAEAGQALAWDVKAATSADPMSEVVKDLKKLVQAGTKTLKAEVADELKKKKVEERDLEKVVASLTKLSEKSDKAFPTEVEYSHTARDITQGFFTKTEAVELEDAGQAKETLQTIEKSLNRWGKLRVQMLEDLQQTDKRLNALSSDLEPFVVSSKRLIDELLLTFA